MDAKLQQQQQASPDTGQVVLEGAGGTMALIANASNIIHGMPIALSENGLLSPAGMALDKHQLHVPVTFVVSDPAAAMNLETKLVGNNTNGAPVFSAINLQEGESAAQFFIEHIAAGGPHLQTEDGEAIQLGVNPATMATINGGNAVPVLVQLANNPEPQMRHLVMDCRGTDKEQPTANANGSDNSPAMYTIHLAPEESAATPSTPGSMGGQSNQKSLETPQQQQNEADRTGSKPVPGSTEGAKLDQERPVHFANGDVAQPLQLLTSATRLEDFMDVVTTYKCKFCRFSCAWKSGLMSHIRCCHLDIGQKGILMAAEDLAGQNPAETSASRKKEPQDKSSNSAKEPSNSQEVAVTETKTAQESNSHPQNVPEMCVALNAAIPNLPPPQERHIFLCGQCSRSFETLEDCKEHMIKDHNLKIEMARNHRVQKNRKRSGSKAEYSDHVKCEDVSEQDDEQGKRKGKTPRCLEVDYLLGSRKRRIYRDTMSDRPYKFKAEANLQYHSRCHNSSGDKLFVCPECNEPMDHWRSVSMHLWKAHGIDLDLHTCGDCGYKTYSLFKLDNHKRIHREEREFVCQTCGKGFKQLSQLRNHHVIHLDRKNMSEKRWYSEQECDVCNRTFSDSKCLRKHQQAVHSKLKPYICNFCGHTSARKAMLQLHMRQHTGEKPFVCDYCEYRTGDHNSLRRHRMRHTGMKPYKCPHCAYACIQAISYKTHLKNKHPGMAGLFACPLCTFRSVSNENFLNHMSDHKRGEIPVPMDGTMAGNDDGVDHDDPPEAQPPRLHVPEATLHQLEGMLPGNMTAAQLIYNCLNALSQEGGTGNLPPGVTTTSTGDGTQTITIQLPTSSSSANPQDSGVSEPEQYYLTIQQQDTLQALVAPEVQNIPMTGDNDTILQPAIAIMDSTGNPQEMDASPFAAPEIEGSATAQGVSNSINDGDKMQ